MVPGVQPLMPSPRFHPWRGLTRPARESWQHSPGPIQSAELLHHSLPRPSCLSRGRNSRSALAPRNSRATWLHPEQSLHPQASIPSGPQRAHFRRFATCQPHDRSRRQEATRKSAQSPGRLWANKGRCHGAGRALLPRRVSVRRWSRRKARRRWCPMWSQTSAQPPAATPICRPMHPCRRHLPGCSSRRAGRTYRLHQCAGFRPVLSLGKKARSGALLSD